MLKAKIEAMKIGVIDSFQGRDGAPTTGQLFTLMAEIIDEQQKVIDELPDRKSSSPSTDEREGQGSAPRGLPDSWRVYLRDMDDTFKNVTHSDGTTTRAHKEGDVVIWRPRQVVGDRYTSDAAEHASIVRKHLGEPEMNVNDRRSLASLVDYGRSVVFNSANEHKMFNERLVAKQSAHLDHWEGKHVMYSGSSDPNKIYFSSMGDPDQW